jgi:hypothetical protein
LNLRRIVLADDAVGAWVTTSEGRRPAAPGEVLGFDRLADALRERAGVDVVVSDRLPSGASDEEDAGTAVILPRQMLREALGERYGGPDIGGRVVVAGTDRTTTLDMLERYGLAGAVEQGAWSRWMAAAGDAEQPRAAITGRLDVAAAMGADFKSAPPWASAHYGPLASAEYPDLPAILAAYLTAYFERLARA